MKILIATMLVSLLFPITVFGQCFGTTFLRVYTNTCSDELSSEWRPKLSPVGPCANLVAEVENINRRINANDLTHCSTTDVSNDLSSAGIVLINARRKGWATPEEYRLY